MYTRSLPRPISNGVPELPLDVPWRRDDAPDEPGGEDPEAAPEGSGPWVRSVDVTREQVLEALEDCDWNKTCAYQRLGMKNRDALRHAMKRLGIPARRPPEDEA